MSVASAGTPNPSPTMTDDSWLEPKTPEEVGVILTELRRRLEGIYEDRLRALYLYGSYARGEAERGSDMDVLVVLDEVPSPWDEIRRTSRDTAELSLEHDLTICTVFVSEEMWLRGDTTFLRNIRSEGRAA